MNGTAILALLAVAPPRPAAARAAAADHGQRPDRAERSEETIARARIEGELERERLAERAAAAAAMATCTGRCATRVARGEMALGMNEAQVLAATRTTPAPGTSRRCNRGGVMTDPRAGPSRPARRGGRGRSIVLQDGRVRSYTYREPQGLRTVTAAPTPPRRPRAAAQADALLRQGDDYTLAGDLVRALDRYDRADILRPGHPETTLRIATTLDKQLRPIEAVLRYRLFIHQLELERIQAQGEAAARIAEAITRAQERIIVLERRQ
jgi:hypothetical protein